MATAKKTASAPTMDELLALVTALSAQVAAQGTAQVAETPAPVTFIAGDHFASLGYVATGKGKDPGEGALVEVPTKAGKIAKVRLVQRIDMTPFPNVDGGDWSYTYHRIRRGEIGASE